MRFGRFGHIGQFWVMYIFRKLRSCTLKKKKKKIEKKSLIGNLHSPTSGYQSQIFWIFYAKKYCEFNFCPIFKKLMLKYSEEQL